MARADWGGGSNLDGLFASLQDDWANRVQASVNRDISRSAEQQAADDADAYDKWTNGLMPDEEWLAYLNARVDATVGDPKEHEQWVETYRKHRTAIEDAQFETAYNEGTTSINNLLAHYSDRLSGIEKNSPAYRTTESRYFELLDKRDSENIEDQASYILARINRGQAGYKELLNLYTSMLSKVRSSSPLYRQLKQNIQSIQDVADGVSGGRSGGGSGGGGGGGLSGDAYTKASRDVLELWNSGNVFVPGGEDVSRSVFDIYNVNTGDPTDVWNALAEDSVVIEQMLDNGQTNPNEPYMINPWGDKIPNTLESRQLLMNQGLRGYDFRIALGNAEGRSVVSVLGARDTFVNKTFGAANSASASDYWQQTRQNAWERFELASQNPDPKQAMMEYAAAGKNLADAGHRILGDKAYDYRGNEDIQGGGLPKSTVYGKSTRFPEEQVDDKMQDEIRFALELATFAKNSPNMTPEDAASAASILFDSRPEGFWLKEKDLEQVLGNDQLTTTESGFGTDYKVGTGIIGKSIANRGLQSADIINGGGLSEVEPFVYVGILGQSAPMAVPISAVNGALDVDDYKDGSTRGGWEKVGNKTVWVVRPLKPVKVPQWYQHENGRWLTAELAQKYGRSAQALVDAGYSPKEFSQLAGWTQITDGDGKEWYVDPEDGHLYPDKPPFKAGITGPGVQMSDFVDEGGNPVFEREAASTGKGFIAFWTSDVSTREVQVLTERILANPDDDRINLGYFHERDGQNNVDINDLLPDKVAGMFWSASDAAVMDKRPRGRGRGIAEGQRGQRLEILERAELRRKAAVKDWTDKQLANAPNKLGFGKYLQLQAREEGLSVGQFAEQQINLAAKAAGISLGRKTQTIDQTQELERLRRPMPVAPSTVRQFAPAHLSRPNLQEGPVTPPPPVVRPIPIPTVSSKTKVYSPRARDKEVYR